MSKALEELLDLLGSIENRLLAKDGLTPKEEELLETTQRRKKQGEALRGIRELKIDTIIKKLADE